MQWTWWDGVIDARVLAREGKEVWAYVPEDYDYAVSNLGRVASLKHGLRKVLSGTVMESGRLTVSLSGKGTRLVYQLVVRAFDGPPPSEVHTDVRHLNCDRTDNRLSNLCWGTRQENMKDTADHRRQGGVRKQVDVEATRTRKWYQGLTSNTDLVRAGLALYHQKKVQRADLAVMWQCSLDTVSNILSGSTQSDVPRPEGFQQVARNRGEAHRDAVCTDAQILEALDLYVKNHWSCKQFATHLGMKPGTADAILIGRNRAYLKKPEGFLYPWPDARTMNKRQGADHGCAKLTEDKVREALQKIVAGEFTSVRAVQSFLGLAKGPTYTLLNGDSWAHIPRPEGFDAAVKKMQRTILSPETQEAIMADLRAGMSRKDVQEKYDLSQDKSYFYTSKLKAKAEAKAAAEAAPKADGP